MADEKLLQIIRQGVDAWNEWREGIEDPELLELDLRWAGLRGLNLDGFRSSNQNIKPCVTRSGGTTTVGMKYPAPSDAGSTRTPSRP